MNNTTMSTPQTVIVNKEAELIALFNVLIQIVSQVLDCFTWIAGNVGAICTCIIFSQPKFRKSPCAMYFIASCFSQLFLFNFAVFIRMIQYGYNVPVNSLSVWFCKIRYYIFHVSEAIARYNIIFATIDRYLCSSHKVHFRQWSSPKIALRIISINAIVWILFYIQVLISHDLMNNKCRIIDPELRKYFNLYVTIEAGFIPIIPMLLFGLLTIHNIHKSVQRSKPTGSISENRSITNNQISRKETQLHKMLICNIIVYIILHIPFAVYNLYRSYFFNVNLLIGSQALIDTFLNNFFYDLTYLGYTLTFLNFFLASNMFRQEFKKIIQRNIFCINQQRIAPVM